MVAGGAVVVPGSDTLNCASVKICEGLRGQAKFLQPPEKAVHHTVCVGGPFQIVSVVYSEELEDFHLPH